MELLDEEAEDVEDRVAQALAVVEGDNVGLREAKNDPDGRSELVPPN